MGTVSSVFSKDTSSLPLSSVVSSRLQAPHKTLANKLITQLFLVNLIVIAYFVSRCVGYTFRYVVHSACKCTKKKLNSG